MARQYISGTQFGAVGIDDAESGREWIGPGIGIDEGAASGTTYNDAIVEATTAATETLTGLADRQGPIAEAGTAAETVAGLLTFTGAIAETASAADTVGGLLVVIGAIAESASALEDTDATVTAGGTTYNKDQAETAAAAETVGGLAFVIGAVAEAASAAETVGGLLTFTGAIAEAGSATDATDASLLPIYDETVFETLAAADTLTADVISGEVTPEVPVIGGPGPAGEGVRRRFEIFLLEDEDEPEKPRRKRRLRLKKAELEEKIEATVEYIEAGSPRPMSQQAMVAEVSTLMGLDALLEIDRRRVERTIYRYLQTLMEQEEEEGLVMTLLAA